MQQLRPESSAMTFDEISMERSKSFVKALQELKNLRPQLYSAAEYCEKSYLHTEHKQMVLDNLKDYAVRALVNAVDHLGTVTYKLTDLFEQHKLDVSTMELKVSSLNQQLLTCQIYTDKEGLRQQQLFTVIPGHHKHYILPINKKVQFSPQIQIDARQMHIQARPRFHPSGNPPSQTLSWHLASETKSTLNRSEHTFIGMEDTKASGATSGVFQLLGSEEAVSSKSTAACLHSASGGPSYNTVLQTFCVTERDTSEGSKSLMAFRSLDNMGRHEIIRPTVRSKSMLSAFFVKPKSSKQ
ncbi:PREDICTED: protein ABIL1-like isoform X2 [Nelumbo nucifera]|uniref:Protein ABIL1-like isoform X2 n=2 Tax=Nelumbo nucifera TaxID=4432 RepID=A0A1U7ZS01_NELNU|nr:PREDICTED: protein ABIL1-like isoform X2 [Nelumbo nucifera]DAD43239.1 TPA_asm: hypothetical protein HUJ06_001469 [Nelumbo nucifera]